MERNVSEPKVEGEVEECTRREPRQATTGFVSQIIGSQFPKFETFSGSDVLGKEEVSFEPFECKTVEPHYKESLMQEAILHSLKGSATSLVLFVGPNTTVKTILQKLETVYSTVASFETLMSNFNKEIQDNNDKIWGFAIKLEGVLNQIKCRFPAKLG